MKLLNEKRENNIYCKDMGNCVGGVQYISKETFHPSDDAFNALPLSKDIPDPEKHIEYIKSERPLTINVDDKLKMIVEHSEIILSGGGMLYKMRNMNTGQTGLVMSESVAKMGTVDCEK